MKYVVGREELKRWKENRNTIKVEEVKMDREQRQRD